MGVNVTYKGNTITSFNSGNSKILNTSGKFMEDNVTIASTLNLQSKTVNPTSSAQTITADSGYDGLSSVSVTAVKAHVATITGTGTSNSNELCVRYDSVKYYQNGDSFTFNSGETALLNCMGSRGGGEILVNGTRVAYNSQDGVYNYSYTLPDCNITINLTYASASTMEITEDSTSITLQSKTVSPTTSIQTITADNGYDGLSQVTVSAISPTKAAETFNVSSSNQTINSGRWLTGTQTFRGVTTSGISAENIKAGTTVKVGDSADDDRIIGVTGTFTSDANATATDIVSGKSGYVNGVKINGSLVVQTYYTGSSEPSNSLGQNGDIYLQTE